MNDFEAPKLDDAQAPRVFSRVTAHQVQDSADFVMYLITQEVQRRQQTHTPPLTDNELAVFRRQLTSLVVVHQNVQAAINLRPRNDITTQQLNG